jgi:hypothetical protein
MRNSECFRTFKCLEYNTNHNHLNDFNTKLSNFQYPCGTFKRTFGGREMFHKIMTIPTLLYGSEMWTLKRQDLNILNDLEKSVNINRSASANWKEWKKII